MVGVFAGRFDLEVGIFIPKGHTKKLVAKKWRPQCSPPGPFGPLLLRVYASQLCNSGRHHR